MKIDLTGKDAEAITSFSGIPYISSCPCCHRYGFIVDEEGDDVYIGHKNRTFRCKVSRSDLGANIRSGENT